MADITYLDSYKSQRMNDRIHHFWQEQFSEVYNSQFGFTSISDKSLLFLAQPDEKSTFLLFQLIIHALELNPSDDFSTLQSSQKSKVLDIQLFLADRIRFEMMKRLGWLENYNGQSTSIMEIISEFGRFQYKDNQHPPQLSKNHQNYREFLELIDRDKGVFVRKLFPDLIEAFEKNMSN